MSGKNYGERIAVMARGVFSGVSMDPDKREAKAVSAYAEELYEDLEELESLGSVGNYESKYLEKNGLLAGGNGSLYVCDDYWP